MVYHPSRADDLNGVLLLLSHWWALRAAQTHRCGSNVAWLYAGTKLKGSPPKWSCGWPSNRANHRMAWFEKDQNAHLVSTPPCEVHLGAKRASLSNGVFLSLPTMEQAWIENTLMGGKSRKAECSSGHRAGWHHCAHLPLSSRCAYYRINTPAVQAAGNILYIKVNVKGIHMRSKGQEIENNPTPCSWGPSIWAAFASAALSSAQRSQ